MIFLLIFLFQQGNISLETNTQNLNWDQELILTATNLPTLREQLFTPNAQGLIPFFLWEEKKEGNKTLYVLKPNFAGIHTLKLDNIPPFTITVTPGVLNKEVPFAKLVPLIPGDPLNLSAPLQEKIFEESQAETNQEIFNARQFPWEKIIPLILFMGFLPWIIKRFVAYQKGKKRPLKPVTLEELIHKLSLLQEEKFKDQVDTLAHVLKLSFAKTLNQPTDSLTYQEILHKLKHLKPPPQINWEEVRSRFQEIERIQFKGEPPEKAKWEEIKNYVLDWVVSQNVDKTSL